MSAAGLAAAAAAHPAQPVLGVAVVGCGLIGRRRARAALQHPRTSLQLVIDSVPDAARAAADGACAAGSDWRAAIDRPGIDIVVVSTPNGLLAEVAIAALEAGRHVLMEKPMGSSLDEARRIHAAAARAPGVLHVGFNHRHHPAIARAATLAKAGAIGRLLWIRARYGHGGRPGIEHEWRSDPLQAGGGELIDQGVHVADLIHWLAGMPTAVFGELQTAVWPIRPLEDNAFALLRFEAGVVAQMHVSMTQWKNLFSLELHGEAGALVVEGLGGSYGTERLIRVERAFAGGAPTVHEQRFEGEDTSWQAEWEAFIARIQGQPAAGGSPDDGLAAMRIVDAIYRSAAAGAPVTP